jgi:hypothetical protein
MRDVIIGDTTYFVRDSISAGDGLRWIESYWTNTESGKSDPMLSVAHNMRDFDFLVEAVLLDANKKPVKPADIPFAHAPILIKEMREALHLKDFIAAMQGDKEPAAVEPDKDTAEKN